MGGPHCIIIQLRGPTCKSRIARTQDKLSSKLGPSVAIITLVGKNNTTLSFYICVDHISTSAILKIQGKLRYEQKYKGIEIKAIS